MLLGAVWQEVQEESAGQAVNSRTGALGDVYGATGLGQDVRWEAPEALAAALFQDGRMLHGIVYSRGVSGKNTTTS
jgi:hypothetical protein